MLIYFPAQEKLGKRKLALEWIKLFFGGNVKLEKNPDLILIEPEENEIKISQIRDLNWKLSLKPFAASLKVAIIDKSHLMNQEAQNCFLKTLEEPKENTYLILITEYPDSLLSTILSRSKILNFIRFRKKKLKII